MNARMCGGAVLACAALLALVAPVVAPNPPTQQFRDHSYAPPMRIRLVDADGRLRAPFVYPLRLVDRPRHRFETDTSAPQSLAWFYTGSLLQVSSQEEGPLLLLGADELGRDVWSRLVLGIRMSLGVAVAAAIVALIVGALWGAAAASAGGWTDEILMRIADFTVMLPALYVVLVMRTALPEVLSSPQVFLTMTTVFAAVGWPYVARGVRAVVLSEQQQDYTLAARGLGVSNIALLTRHFLPATYGVLAVQAGLLVPGFILAEAALSFVGLGFPVDSASWGVMLGSGSSVTAIVDHPWLLSPVAAIVAVVLGVNLLLRTGHEPLRWMTRSSSPRA